MADAEKGKTEPPKSPSILNNDTVNALSTHTTAINSPKTSSNSSNKKQHSNRLLTNESRVTLMVIIISLNSLFGNVPNSISSLYIYTLIQSLRANFLVFLSA